MTLIAYWKEAIIAILSVLLVLSMFRNDALKSENKAIQSEVEQYKTALSFQNASIEAQRIDNEKLKNLPKTIERIKTRYVAVFNDINTIKDNNETILFDRLNSFNY